MTVTERKPVHTLSNTEIVEEARRYAQRLKDAGVAERAIPGEVARKYPGAVVIEAAAEQKRADVLEKDEQRAIRKMAIAAGFRVYWLSQARESGQTPGLGDLWMMHMGKAIALWWETKRQVGGNRSTPQEEFAALCDATNTHYGFGDRHAFHGWLMAHGFPALPIPE